MLPAPLLRTLEGTTSRRWMERNNPASLRRWLGAQRANPAPLLKPKMEQKQHELLCCHTKCFPHSAIRLRSIWSTFTTRLDSLFHWLLGQNQLPSLVHTVFQCSSYSGWPRLWSLGLFLKDSRVSAQCCWLLVLLLSLFHVAGSNLDSCHGA